MAILNSFNCGTNLGNTGKSDCAFALTEVYGVILVPKSFVMTAIQMQTLKTTLIGLAQSDDKSQRIYPIGVFREFDDKSTEATSATSGYGFMSIDKPGVYSWDFSYQNGICFMKSIVKFRGLHSKFNLLLVTRDETIIGLGNQDGGMTGIPLSLLYPRDTPLPKGDGKAYDKISFSLEDSTGFNENMAFVKEDGFSPITELEGMIDVLLTKDTPAITATTVDVKASINCGGTNLVDNFATELATPSVWVVKNTVTGVTVTPTSVVATGTGFKFTFSASTGLRYSISLAAPSVLEAASIVSPNGNYLESNVLMVIFP